VQVIPVPVELVVVDTPPDPPVPVVLEDEPTISPPPPPEPVAEVPVISEGSRLVMSVQLLCDKNTVTARKGRRDAYERDMGHHRRTA
jgi:hypothetical protein